MAEQRVEALKGRRIAISRRAEDARPLVELLLTHGAVVWASSLIRIEPPRDPAPLATAALQREHYDWVVVTSTHAARALAEARGSRPWPASVQVAAVGESTARVLSGLGVSVALVPDEASGKGLAAALSQRSSGGVSGKSVLFPRSNIAGRALPEDLRQAGAEVEEVEAYATHSDLEQASDLLAGLRDHPPDAILLTSPSNAESLAGAAAPELLATALASVRVVSIGPTTSARLMDLGRPPDAEARRQDPHSILEAIRTAVR